MTHTAELAGWLALVYASGFSQSRSSAIVTRWCLETGHPLSALFDAPVSELSVRLDLTPVECDAVSRLRGELASHESWCRLLSAAGVRIITRSDPAYPAALAHGLVPSEQPPLLFVRGELPPPGAALAAVVGDRETDPWAADTTRDLAGLLSTEGIVVVSGLSQGIGRAAAEGALATRNGRTLSIVPLGISALSVDGVFAPAIAQGRAALVSPFHPDTPFSPAAATARNCLIAVLADAMIVMVARWRGPVCEMAEEARRLGRAVYVWEANPADEEVVRGRELLLDAGALPIGEMSDVLEIIAGVAALTDGRQAGPYEAGSPIGPEVSAEADGSEMDPQAVLAVLQRSGHVPDSLLRRLLRT